jgi:hypothetical protein
MLSLSKTLGALKQAVIRGVARHNQTKLPTVEVQFVDGKEHMTNFPWLTLGPMVRPCQLTDERPVVSKAPGASALISESSVFLPCSSSPT